MRPKNDLPKEGTIIHHVMMAMLKGTTAKDIEKIIGPLDPNYKKISKHVVSLENVYDFVVTKTRIDGYVHYKITGRIVRGEVVPVEKLSYLFTTA
jgi:hypothetical protein